MLFYERNFSNDNLTNQCQLLPAYLTKFSSNSAGLTKSTSLILCIRVQDLSSSLLIHLQSSNPCSATSLVMAINNMVFPSHDSAIITQKSGHCTSCSHDNLFVQFQEWIKGRTVKHVPREFSCSSQQSRKKNIGCSNISVCTQQAYTTRLFYSNLHYHLYWLDLVS